MLRIAAETGKTPAQLLLRWAIQRGTVPIPKSVNPDRLRQNLAATEFQLSPSQMAALYALDSNYRFIDGSIWAVRPGASIKADVWDE